MYSKSISNNHQIGKKAETLICDYLKTKGYEIIETNYRCHFGEIDIIAKEKGYIVFIEVKYRKNAALGYPSEAVNHLKIQKIIKTSLFYIHQNRISLNSNYRYDIVCVLNNKVQIIKNAFPN